MTNFSNENTSQSISENIPKPDTTGSQNTQTIQGDIIPARADSQMSIGMSGTVHGLASTNTNINKHAFLLVASQFEILEKNLAEAQKELNILRPEIAVLKVRIKLLSKMSNIHNFVNTIGGILFTFGTSIVTGLITTNAFDILKPIGWILAGIGLILILVASKPISDEQ